MFAKLYAWQTLVDFVREDRRGAKESVTLGAETKLNKQYRDESYSRSL
jgi:hypothetical protein